MALFAGQTRGEIADYFRHSSSPVQSVALTLPLLCVYGLGILISPDAQNGVDFITQWLYVGSHQLGPWRNQAYLGFYGSLIAANVWLLRWLTRQNRLSLNYFLPLLVECGLYAMVTGTLSAMVTRDVTHALHAIPLAAGAVQYGPIDGVVVSAGAGLHEELVFRLGMIGVIGRLWLGQQWRQPSRQLLGLLVFSSLIFSLAHYLGPEQPALSSFVFRTVSGLVFGTLFLLRGFAVAAWTHALYDVWVIVLVGA
jgi:membrane protease YdiL (CAAX protease family)